MAQTINLCYSACLHLLYSQKMLPLQRFFQFNITIVENIKTFFTYSTRRTLNACFTLFKLMIPVSVIIHIIQVADILPYISHLLQPVMQCVGLPAETALIWLTALVVNIYGGLLSLFTIYPSLSEPLSVAQMTVLLTMILIAHTFPIELGIAKKTGIKVWIMFSIRFFFSIIAGIILSHIYQWLGWLQSPVHITNAFTASTDTWGAWALHELKNYGLITCMIFILVNFIHLLEVTGAMKWFNKIMLPALGWLGISEAMLPLTVVGLTMGIAYGGGLIIDEGRKPNVKAKDIFYSMALMGLFHSIIEDTLLMLGMGGHWTGIILFRALFAFVIVYIMVQLCNKIPESTICRIFMTKAYNKQRIASDN